MNRTPKISVVMAVYNAEPHLAEAIDSMLRQTYGDFELLAVNDASLDQSRALLQEFERRDRRVRVFDNDRNLGAAETRNRAFKIARGEYLAIMDADDLSLPDRFQRQVEFMDSHPEVGVSGTGVTTFGAATGTCQHPIDDAEIKIHHLLLGSYLAHSSAIIRRSVLERTGIFYRQEEAPAEDYWLWIRLGFETQLANVADALVRYRIHPNQLSQTDRTVQDTSAARARAFYAGRIFGRALTAQEERCHAALGGWLSVGGRQEFEHVRSYALGLIAANAAVRHFDQRLFGKTVDDRLTTLRRQYAEQRYKYAGRYDVSLLARFVRDPLRPALSLGVNDNLRLAMKCLVGHRTDTWQ